MSGLVDRSHMRPAQVLGPVVERVKVEQPTVENVVGGGDIIWNSYYHLRENFISQSAVGALPVVSAPVDTTKKTFIVAGKEVKRMPHLDDFAEMVRSRDYESHTRLDAHINPLGPTSLLDWFEATMLAVMIENGRIGIKEDMFGNRAVYAYRARAGNPFFRIFGGRTAVLIAIAQWFVVAMALWGGVISYEAGQVWFGSTVILGSVVMCFVYSFIHWRFHKRYAFILSRTVVDGWKTRNMGHRYDGKWVHARMAAHAINLAVWATVLVGSSLYAVKGLGWL